MKLEKYVFLLVFTAILFCQEVWPLSNNENTPDQVTSAYGPRDISGSNISTLDTYVSGNSSQNISFAIVLQTSDDEYFDYVSMTFPNGFTINSADYIDGIGYTISNGSKTITWIDNSYYISPGTYNVNVNMDISISVTGDRTVFYEIQGDGSGGGTHYISSSFIIQQSLPDLIITNMAVTPSNQYEDDFINIIVTVKNQGTASTDGGYVSVFYDLDYMPTTYDLEDNYGLFGYLGTGDSESVTIYPVCLGDFYEYTYGPHNIHGYVDCWYSDPNGYIEESNENNNAYGPIQIGWIEQPTPDYYPWPVDPDNAPHEISSVVNEYRPPAGVTPEHTHKGIDIPKPQGEPVYSVSSGKVRARNTSGNNTFIRLKGTLLSDTFEYYHLQNIHYGLFEWIYEKGGTIAEVGDYPQGTHLHFNDWTMYGDPDAGGAYYATNPIRAGGLDYTQDYSNPLIKSDYLRIQPNGSNEVMDSEHVHGLVDFIIAAKDISATGNRIGLAKISFTIGGLNYQVVILDGDRVFNSDVIDYLYCKHCGGGQPYSPDGYVYYYTTNDITDPDGSFQNYFDTDLLIDGNYELCITVEDYAGNTDEACFNITINNSANMEDNK